MHDPSVDAAARVVAPTKRKVRKLAVGAAREQQRSRARGGTLRQSRQSDLGSQVGEYLSAPDARRHLWHACFASGHPSFRWQTAAAATRLYHRLTYASWVAWRLGSARSVVGPAISEPY